MPLRDFILVNQLCRNLLGNLSLEQSGSYISVLSQKFEKASKTLVGRYQLGDLILFSSNFNCF